MPIDHVELFVPSRAGAAEWYEKVIGCQVLEEFRSWATGTGPLMISDDGGETKIALFKGRSQGDHQPRGFRRVAFRVSASEFLDFLRSSGDWRSTPLGTEDIVDHDKSISVYFEDPYGNLLEVTSYDHDAVRTQLL